MSKPIAESLTLAASLRTPTLMTVNPSLGTACESNLPR
jgi:hypothetical protein